MVVVRLKRIVTQKCIQEWESTSYIRISIFNTHISPMIIYSVETSETCRWWQKHEKFLTVIERATN